MEFLHFRCDAVRSTHLTHCHREARFLRAEGPFSFRAPRTTPKSAMSPHTKQTPGVLRPKNGLRMTGRWVAAHSNSPSIANVETPDFATRRKSDASSQDSLTAVASPRVLAWEPRTSNRSGPRVWGMHYTEPRANWGNKHDPPIKSFAWATVAPTLRSAPAERSLSPP